MRTKKTLPIKKQRRSRLAAMTGSAARREPRLSYDQWKALGAEKAAEYYAKRNGLNAARQGKLWAILETAWNEKPQNAKLCDGRE